MIEDVDVVRPAADFKDAAEDDVIAAASLDATQRSSHRLSAGQLAFLQAFSSMMQKT